MFAILLNVVNSYPVVLKPVEEAIEVLMTVPACFAFSVLPNVNACVQLQKRGGTDFCSYTRLLFVGIYDFDR